MEPIEYFESYINGNPADVAVNQNANNNRKSFNHFNFQLLSPVLKDIGRQVHQEKMSRLFDPSLSVNFWEMVNQGLFYFHDQDKMLIPYCFAASTSILSNCGRPYGQLKSLPPKRADSFIAQVIEMTMDLSQEFAGAIALGDIFLEYAKFSLNEKLTDKQIENDFQKFVHVVNNAFRVGGDSPFTNVSIFDRHLLQKVFNINNENIINETIRVQKIFGSFFSKGDPETGLPYRFPVVTLNLFTEKGQVKDEEFLNWAASVGGKGVFNIYLTEDVGKISSCCRLLNDTRFMSKNNFFDSFGNGGINIGSHRVISINFAKFIDCKIEDEAIKGFCEMAVKALIAHREILRDLIEKDFLKFFKPLRWINLDRMFFSTIGLIGFYEYCNGNIEEMKELLIKIRDISYELSDKYGIPINIEQIPAESAAVKLAEGTGYPILSSQYLPLWEDHTIEKRLRVAGEFDSLITGGSITHLNVGSEISPGQFKKLVNLAAKYGCHHFAINPVFSKCTDGHITMGKTNVCGSCGAGIEDYVTRVIGYFTPVSSWNPGRRNEFERRKWNVR